MHGVHKMSLLTIPNTFSAGAVIIASQHNANFSTIVTDYNGNIDNNNISASAAIAYSKLTLTGSILNADVNASAAIVDTKLAQIATASKVHGTSITGLASLPSGAGVIPVANLGTGASGTTFLRGDGTFQVTSPTSVSFSAHNNAVSQNMDTGTDKILFDTELWDTNSNFASSRFTPTVAGKYQLSAAVLMTGNSLSARIAIYKNGAEFKSVRYGAVNSPFFIATTVDANGSTDYFEIYMVGVTTNSDTDGAPAQTWFAGARVF